MELNKISARNAWNAVAHITEQMRGHDLNANLSRWLTQQGFCLEETVFAFVCRFDQNIYTGTLVDSEGRVWEFFADLDSPADSELEDVTAGLGPKCPDHPNADFCDPVTMAQHFHRETLTAA